MNGPLAGVRLMLVEDERIVAFNLKTQLQNFGYRVAAVVASGEQAVQRMAEAAPDLVLMDIRLEGDMDGIDAATEIQARYRTPVIFLTAFAEDDTLRRALDSRPFGYLVKPCEARELHAMIQMALGRRAAELAVEESERRLTLALDAAALGVLEWHPGSHRLHGEGHLGALFGERPLPLDEPWDDFLARVAEADRQQVGAALAGVLTQGEAVRIEFRTARGDGPRYLEAHAKAFADPAGERRVVGILQDVTRRRLDEEHLRQSSVVFATTAEAIVITDAARRIAAVNAAFSRITGYSEEEAIGFDVDLLLRIRRDSRHVFALLEASSAGYWHGEVICHRRSGESFPVWQSLSVVRDAAGRAGHFVLAFSDVTAIHAAEEKLHHLAHHDPLTGLPNRLLFDDRFEQAIEQARRQEEPCALLFLDLDSFKMVNDTLGHAAGDELLQVVSGRLKGVLRRSDTVARLGGDEFVILAVGASAEYAAALAEKILAALRVPVCLGRESITVSCSIGIAVFPADGDDRPLLLRAADTAMYSAKAEGRNCYRFYTREMSARTDERMHTEQGLRRAIAAGELAVHYQPQVDLADGRVVGIEALVRWPRRQQAMVPPERFIPIAEDSGVIEELGRWVLARACREMAALAELAAPGQPPLRLAVNVSARQFVADDFVAAVGAILAETGFPATALELEITESTLQVIERSVGILNALKELGISVSIDDFGTGYSSLSVLRDLPIDRIKIDRSFIVDLPGNAEGRAIVEAVVALAKSLGMGIIVEGIERAEQAELLRRLGCDEGQGYLFSPALTYDGLVGLLRERNRRL